MYGIGAHARTTPDVVALYDRTGEATMGELDLRQRRLAGFLLGSGVGTGDRIAVASPNRKEYLEVTAGTLRAGIVPVPIHPLLTAPEIDYVLRDSGAKFLFGAPPDEVAMPAERIIRFGHPYEDIVNAAAPADIADVTLTRPLHYTSGTTGDPKGVWVPPASPAEAVERAASFARLWDITADDRHLVCSPLSHSAPHRFALRTLESGGSVVVQERFDAIATLAAIERFGITSTFVVPTHLERIVAAIVRTGTVPDLATMRLLVHAGAPIRESTKRAVIEHFPAGSVWEFYGSTEGQATRAGSEEWLAHPGTVGRPLPGIEISIRQPGGEGCPAGEIGEVWIGGDVERFEYLNDPEKTAAAWRAGSFSVGDLGYLDGEGFLYLTGRKHDTIISGGVNVYPQEVESVLLEHPRVAEAMVFGVEDPEWGQRAHAWVVPEPGGRIDGESVRMWLKQRIAGYKCPRHVEVVEHLPRTATGKLIRNRMDQ